MFNLVYVRIAHDIFCPVRVIWLREDRRDEYR